MLTFRPYGAWILFDARNYKHCVPTGLAKAKGTTFQQWLCASQINYTTGGYHDEKAS